MRRRTAKILGIAVVATLSSLAAQPLGANPRQTAAHASAGFAPLAQWRAAVMAGDKAALAKFYLPDSPAPAPMADGKKPTPADREPAFWSALPSQGLTNFEPKILQREQPRANTTFLVLRVEMTFHAPSGEMHRMVAPVRQTWVNENGWHIAATRRGDAEPMEAISLPQPATPNPHLYPDPADAQQELAGAFADARVDHKRVLVIFGATWCYDCHVLDATLRSPRVAALVATSYHVIHINIGDDRRNADMAQRFEVPLDKGIPSLAVLDGDGRLITSQKQGEFESAAKIGMQDVTGFLNRSKPAEEKLRW
jgi:thioredoxin 1